MPPQPDHYAELGLQPTATPEEIKAAYRGLAKKYHPDLHGGDPKATARFQRIGEAFRVLNDPAKRLEYHRQMGFQLKVQQAAKAAKKAQPAARKRAPKATDSFAETLKNAFRGGFGFSTASPASDGEEKADAPTGKPGEPLGATLKLTPLQMASGGTFTLKTTRRQPCRTCGGTGTRRGGADLECPRCVGLGEVPTSKEGRTVFVTCPDCDGEGVTGYASCGACQATGMVATPATLEVVVPPGHPNGGTVRLKGAGHAGRNGGPAGDAVITVEEVADGTVRRDGDRLIITVHADLLEALGGRELEVETPAGVESVRLSSSVLNGKPVVLAGKGAPRADGGRGDVSLDVRVQLPDRLTPKALSLLRELVQEPGWKPPSPKR